MFRKKRFEFFERNFRGDEGEGVGRVEAGRVLCKDFKGGGKKGWFGA